METHLLQRHREMIEAYNAKDLTKVATYLTNDVQMWKLTGPVIDGKEAYLKECTEWLAEDMVDVQVERPVAHTFSVECGEVYCVLRGKEVNYKSLTIWNKVKGEWYLFRDIYGN